VSVVEQPRETQQQDINADLGFGSVVSRESQRLLNKDGTFNVQRQGLPLLHSIAVYHYLLNITWPKFLAYVTGSYVITNALFAVAYILCGDTALSAFGPQPMPARFWSAFFFSVDTLATIGYGNISPNNTAANVVVTVEALIGLLGFSVVAGIVFARFARPVAKIAFSRNAIIAPYRDQRALMFRIVNEKSNEIVELRATVLLTRRKPGVDGSREYHPLKLERERVVFFPASWTIVHPIDNESPLRDLNQESLTASDAEILILLNGFDETFSQNVHTRSSYRAEEVVWGARFQPMFNPPREDGTISVDIRKLHDIQRVAL